MRACERIIATPASQPASHESVSAFFFGGQAKLQKSAKHKHVQITKTGSFVSHIAWSFSFLAAARSALHCCHKTTHNPLAFVVSHPQSFAIIRNPPQSMPKSMPHPPHNPASTHPRPNDAYRYRYLPTLTEWSQSSAIHSPQSTTFALYPHFTKGAGMINALYLVR